jgi:hypothetical protein
MTKRFVEYGLQNFYTIRTSKFKWKGPTDLSSGKKKISEYGQHFYWVSPKYFVGLGANDASNPIISLS